MNFVFLMDPLSTIKMDKDTTFALMLGAHRKGHRVFYLRKGGITRLEAKTFFHVIQVVPQINPEHPFIVHPPQILNESEVDVLWIRTDPPFDRDYLAHTWLLDLISPKITILNKPAGIRSVNEKIWGSQFVEIVPTTLITRDKKIMMDFLQTHEEIIIKPMNGFGGQGVFRLKVGDSNVNVTEELLSKQFSEEIILQQFVKDSNNGDKRILLLNGEPLGAALRVHPEGDHRNNFFAGGKAEATTITERELEIIGVLRPHLLELGLYFVGIDVIGGFLIEVNVTSPTGLQEMNRLYGRQLEDEVIAFVEKKCTTEAQRKKRWFNHKHR